MADVKVFDLTVKFHKSTASFGQRIRCTESEVREVIDSLSNFIDTGNHDGVSSLIDSSLLQSIAANANVSADAYFEYNEVKQKQQVRVYDSLAEAIAARDIEWNTGGEKLSLTFRATELAEEVGEVCSEIKRMERIRLGIKGDTSTSKEKLAKELGDAVITLYNIALDEGIDLDNAVKEKFNATSVKYGFDVFVKV